MQNLTSMVHSHYYIGWGKNKLNEFWSFSRAVRPNEIQLRVK